MRGKLFAAPLTKVAGGLILALAPACPGLWLRGRAGHAVADPWEAKAVAERDNHRVTKTNVREAQEQAAQAARAARLATEEHSRRLAERADHAEDLAEARAAAARYADAHRLPSGPEASLEVRPASPEPPAKLTLPHVVTDQVPMPWCSSEVPSTSSSATRFG